MPLPKFPPAEVAHHGADSISPPPHGRHFHALVLVVAVGSLGASAGLNLVDDPRPLDVQLSTAMRDARDRLGDWQGQLSRGLQVSLRAVADGRELPPAEGTAITQAAASQPAVEPR